MYRKYILIMIFVLASIMLAAQYQTVRVSVHSNAAADGTVIVADEFLNPVSTNPNAHFINGTTDFYFDDIPDSYDPATLNADAYGSTSWGSWDESGYSQGFFGNPPTCHLYLSFIYPQDMSVFIQTNSDVEQASVVLSNGVNESQIVNLDNVDYDSDGITEVLFEDIMVDGGQFQNVTVTVTGTDVYGDWLSQYEEGFTWYEANHQWENHDINLVYTLPEGEERTFHFGWNWASTPRLFRTGNDGFDAEIVIDDLEPYALWIEAEQPLLHYMQFFPGQPGYWDHFGDFYDFVSTSGYKINMSSDYSSYDLNVYGTILPANTTLTLTGGGYENWIGYFPVMTQRVQNAFGDEMDNLYSIKAQNWAMVRVRPTPGSTWITYLPPGVSPTLSYGDMVIVECFNTNNTFSWQSLSSVDPYQRNKAEHFTYEEEADYIPIFAEFEEGEEPLEIGVKIDGECKGAAKVEGSSVQINAYILEGDGEEVEFEMYYGRAEPETIKKNYTIYNPSTNLHENKKIKAGEYRDFYMISFAEESEEQINTEILKVHHSPNPFYTSTVISYNLPEEKDISLEVFNIKGQRIKTLYLGNSTIGEHQVTWNGTDENNRKVSSGIYFYKLITPEKVISKKMLLMR